MQMTKQIKNISGILSLLVIVVWFISCNGPASSPVASNNPSTTPTKAVQYGTLRIGMADFVFELMDPTQMESIFGYAIYDSLLTFDSQGNAIGELADNYSLSPDGKTWTFKIHPGITFHNGDPLTSADVKFSLDRFKSENSTNPWSYYLRMNFASDETPDAYTYVYGTNTPEPQLITPFAFLRILPKDYIEKNGIEYFRAHPIGTGPWKFISLTPDLECEFEAVKHHWKRTPAFEKLVFYEIPSEATRFAMLRRGDLDIVTGLSFDTVAKLSSEGYTSKSSPVSNILTISFQYTWLTTGPTSDKRVRQALSYAINRQELCDTYFKGFAEPGGRFFMDENSWGWDPSWTPDPNDPPRARALLAEAGYPDRFADPVINIYITSSGVWTPITSGGWIPDVVLTLQKYWTDIGIQTNIITLEPAVWTRLLFTGIFADEREKAIGDILPFTYTAAPNAVCQSGNIYTSAGWHGTANDPKADELYQALTQELDLNKAKQMWTEFQNYVKEMWVNVGIVKVHDQMVLSNEIDPNNWLELNVSLNDALSSIQHKK